MKIVLFGATGGTGGQVLNEALRRGHEVVAVARHPERLAPVPAGVEVVAGDMLDAPSWREALDGADAVVSAVGIGGQREATTFYSDGARALVGAMSDAGARRLAVISAPPAAPRETWGEYGWFPAHVLFPLLHRRFAATYDDMARMHDVLAASELDWTEYRPPYLTNRLGTGQPRVAIGTPTTGTRSLARADLAVAMLDGLTDDRQLRTTVEVRRG